MTQSGNKTFFWLHIKKSAGQSTRQVLSPYYKTVDRSKHPTCFLQADPSEYNDILNNYRVPLGTYQFRRCLFARTYLYPDNWDDMVKFAFSRNPVSRCVSAFYQFFGGKSKTARANRRLYTKRHHRIALTTSGRFDHFLHMIEEARASDSAYRPYDLHFTTHTAPMWDDITDEGGNILLDHVFRLEDFKAGINAVLRECGLPQVEDTGFVCKNKGNHGCYHPSAAQRQHIEKLYAKDFEIYETLCERPAR